MVGISISRAVPIPLDGGAARGLSGGPNCPIGAHVVRGAVPVTSGKGISRSVGISNPRAVPVLPGGGAPGGGAPGGGALGIGALGGGAGAAGGGAGAAGGGAGAAGGGAVLVLLGGGAVPVLLGGGVPVVPPGG